jgi:uncharacterized membrane protein
MVKVVVLLVVLALLARRFLPRYRLPWMVPIALVAGLLIVRTAGYLLGGTTNQVT